MAWKIGVIEKGCCKKTAIEREFETLEEAIEYIKRTKEVIDSNITNMRNKFIIEEIANIQLTMTL